MSIPIDLLLLGLVAGSIQLVGFWALARGRSRGSGRHN